MEKLYNKYRFNDFDSIIGDLPHIKKLKSDIESGNIDHTYLFYSDTQGTGKTSMARLLSNYIPDVYVEEINASVYNGADEGKRVAKTAYDVPLGYKSKLIIINESMRATGNFFDALLEVFEETGDNLYFIITTTDVKKIPSNIRSRFTDIKFISPDMKSVRSHLSYICEQERINADRKILTKICNKNQNIVRDCISDLELIKGIDSPEDQLKLLEESPEGKGSGYDIAVALKDGSSWADIRKMLQNISESEVEGVRRVVLAYHTKIFIGGGKLANRSREIMIEFMENFNDSGICGLALACENCC